MRPTAIRFLQVRTGAGSFCCHRMPVKRHELLESAVHDAFLAPSSARGPALSVTTVATRPVAVLRACGDLDRDTQFLLTSHVAEVIAAHTPRLVMLDLSGIRFFGAAGITALLQLQEEATRWHADLLLSDPSPCVRWVLGIAGLTDALALDDNPASAVGRKLPDWEMTQEDKTG